MSGVQISDSDMEVLMQRMDQNRDGQISWEEFQTTLGAWLLSGASEGPAEGKSFEEEKAAVGRKRKNTGTPDDGAESRTKIHRKITNFFLQFQRARNFAEVRERFIQRHRKSLEEQEKLGEGLPGGAGAAPGAPQGSQALQHLHRGQTDLVFQTYTETEKLRKLELVARLANDLPEMSAGIHSSDEAAALRCCRGAAEIMSICEVFRTAQERYEICDMLISIFQRIRDSGIIPRLIQFLGLSEMPELQFQAARVITNYAPGPRIAHTPKDSPLHPKHMLHKSDVIRNGGAHALHRLLHSSRAETKRQAVIGLGRIASHDAPARNLLLDMNVFSDLCGLIQEDAPPTLVRATVWAISVFTGHTHSEPPPYEKVAICMEKLAKLFFLNDVELLTHVLTALSHLLPGINKDEPLVKRLCVLLGVKNAASVHSAALEIIEDMIRFDDATQKYPATNLLLRCGLVSFPSLFPWDGGTTFVSFLFFIIIICLLSPFFPIHPSIPSFLPSLCPKMDGLEGLVTEFVDARTAGGILEILGLLTAPEKGFLDGILERSSIFGRLLNLITMSDLHRHRVVKFLLQLTRHPGQANLLGRKLEGLVRVLTKTLSNFKTYDPVLREVYNFMGPRYNFEYISEVLLVLENLLMTANSVEQLRYFELELLDQIRQLMRALSGEMADEMDSWRRAGESRINLEEQLIRFLSQIQAVHERAKSPVTLQVQQEAQAGIQEFQDNIRKNAKTVAERRRQKRQQSAGGSAAMLVEDADESFPGDAGVPLKCFFEGDNRVVPVHRGVTALELQNLVQLKYGQPMLLQYQDADGDLITIDSDQSLRLAWKNWDRTGNYRIALKPFLDGIPNPRWKQQQQQQKQGRRRNRNANNQRPWRGGQGGVRMHLDAGEEDDDFDMDWSFDSGAKSSLFSALGQDRRGGPQRGGQQQQGNRNNPRKMIQALTRETHFSRKDLEKMYRQFRKVADPKGRIDKQQFARELAAIGKTDPKLVDHLFNAFDFDRSGFITFSEFAGGFSVMMKGTMEEKLRLAFDAYDLNGDNVMDRKELFFMLKSSWNASGLPQPDEYVWQVVNQCFAAADHNRDGVLDFEEFRTAVARNQIVVDAFWGT